MRMLLKCFDKRNCSVCLLKLLVVSTLVLGTYYPVCFRCLPAPTHFIQING